MCLSPLIFHLIFLKHNMTANYHHILTNLPVHSCYPHICSAWVIFMNFALFWVFNLVYLSPFKIFHPIFMKLHMMVEYQHILTNLPVHSCYPHLFRFRNFYEMLHRFEYLIFCLYLLLHFWSDFYETSHDGWVLSYLDQLSSSHLFRWNDFHDFLHFFRYLILCLSS